MLLCYRKVGVLMCCMLLSGLSSGQTQTQPGAARKRMVFTSNSARTARVNPSTSSQQPRTSSTAPIVFRVPVPPQPKPEPVPAAIPVAIPKPVMEPPAAVESIKPAAALPGSESPGLCAVDYKGGQLTVVAEKAELGKVLQMLGSKTGASVEVAPEIAAEPVIAHLGPGTPTQIIGQLLDSPHLEYIVMGSDENGNGLKRIVVRRRTSFAREPLVAMQAPAVPRQEVRPQQQVEPATTTPERSPAPVSRQQE